MNRFLLLLTLIASSVFAQGLPVKSGATTDLWTIDTNKHGTVSVYDSLNNPLVIRENYVQVGETSYLFYDPIEGGTLQTNLWTGQASTQTIAVATGVLTLNNGASAAANTNAAIQTIKQFNLQSPDAPVQGIMTAVQPTVGVQANQTVEIGFSDGTSGSAATNGCFFQWNPAAEFRGVYVANGSTLQTAALTAPSINVTHSYYVVMKYDGCDYYVDDALVGSIIQTNTGTPPIAGKLPFTARTINGATPPATAPRLQIYSAAVMQLNLATARDFGRQMASAAARGADRSPISTYAQTANHANSTSPTSATLSNTSTGYTTLGGRWQFAAVAGAATDFALFGFTVPPGYQLHVSSVAISSCNTVAAVATTATVLDWSVASDSSTVSLATADTLGPPPTAWSPRRVPLGLQAFPVAAPNGPVSAGECANDIVRTFDPPLVTNSSRIFHVIVQVPVGTATATEVFRGDVTIGGWFE